MTDALRLKATLDGLVDQVVTVHLASTGVGGFSILGRLYGVTYDIAQGGLPSAVVVRAEDESPIVIPWHAVGVIQRRPG